MYRSTTVFALSFPAILAAVSLACQGGRVGAPGPDGPDSPICRTPPSDARPPDCARLAAGSVVADPPALFSRHGVLNVALQYISSKDAAGRRLYCFVTPDGLESPTLHVHPGDSLDIRLENRIAASKDGGGAGGMAMSVSGGPCGASTMNATSVNMHFHGTGTSPTCHADEVIRTLVNAGETFDYHVEIPRNQPPGLYWYHPHVHGQSEAAVKGGASGAIVVDGLEALQPVVGGLPERTLIVRDQTVAGNPPPGGAVPTSDVTLNYVPIAYPALKPAVIRIVPGRREFWRVLNASAETVLDIALTYDGKDQPLSVVALDGVATGSRNGAAAGRVLSVDHILIPAAGRAEFVVTGPPPTVRNAVLATRAIAMGPDGDTDPARPLARLEPVGAPVGAMRALPYATAPRPPAIGSVDSLDRAPVTARRTLYFSETLLDPYDPASQSKYFITVEGATPRIFNPAAPPAIVTTEGAVEDWTIENRSREMHEFHIHQVHFKVVARDGVRVPPDQQQYLDTAQLPFWTGKGPYPSLTVRMDFRHVRGDILYHCHMLDHEDAGMMAVLRVLPKGAARSGTGA